MEFKGVFCLGVLLFFSTFVVAELNLVVTADLDNVTTDVFIQTNERAVSGFDIYDLDYPPFPMSSPKLFSVIYEGGSRELIMDSWKGENRNLQLVYSRDEEDLGVLNLKFNGDISSAFKVVLHDYGKDSGYENEVGGSLITGGAVYSIDSSEKKRYFLLDVDYLYCGDSICSEEENCSTCSVDCSGCKNEGLLDPYHFLSVLEVGEGCVYNFSFDEGYKFNFKDEVHSVKIVSIKKDSVKLLVASVPMNLDFKWGEERGVDIDSDSVIDFVLRPSLVGVGVVNLYFKGVDINNFGEVSIDDKIVVQGRISVFDRVYSDSSPIWLKILVSVGFLFVGFGLLFIVFFIWIKKIRSRDGDDDDVGVDIPVPVMGSGSYSASL